MKKILIISLSIILLIGSTFSVTISAEEKIVFTDQDFSGLRSGRLRDRGGVESVGAYEEDNWRYWGSDGLLSNGDGYYVGYITYKITAQADETIQTLDLDLIGRIGTYDDGDYTAQEWIDGGEKYWMRIYVFKEDYSYDRLNWLDYEDKVAVIPTLTPNPPDTAQEYSFDLSQWAKDGKDVYVTIATYAEWTPNWIGFSHLTLSGTTASASVTSTPAASNTPTTPASSVSSSASASIAISEQPDSDETSQETSDEMSETESSGTNASSVASESISEQSDETSDEASGETSSAADDKSRKSSVWWIILVTIVIVGGGAGTLIYMKKRKTEGA